MNRVQPEARANVQRGAFAGLVLVGEKETGGFYGCQVASVKT